MPPALLLNQGLEPFVSELLAGSVGLPGVEALHSLLQRMAAGAEAEADTGSGQGLDVGGEEFEGSVPEAGGGEEGEADGAGGSGLAGSVQRPTSWRRMPRAARQVLQTALERSVVPVVALLLGACQVQVFCLGRRAGVLDGLWLELG
jgi:hypothetical protein